MVTPSRIALARKRRGLTLAELSDRAGVSMQSLSNYETGRTAPRAGTLNKLASALDFPAAFFQGPPLEELPADGISWRARSKASPRVLDAARAAGTLGATLYDWIAESFRLPVVDVPSLGKPDPETAAGMVRTRWELGEAPAPNMVHLLEAHGVRVFSLDPDHAEVDAFAVWRDGVPFVFLNTLKSAERGRFDAAHELGHLVMHGSEHACSGPDAERQANAFASAFLMPRASVLGHMPSGAHVDQIIRGKRIWKVSAMALTYRMHDLGLLTDWQYRSTCAELTRLGFRSAEPEGMGQRETSQVLTKVFAALRTKGVRPSAVAAEVGLTGEEMNRLLFGLTLTTVTGGGQQTASTPKRHLSTVGSPTSGSAGSTAASARVSSRRSGLHGAPLRG
ncbi:helix-turn-helix domain-containing protein [Streptomyces sp. NBC_00503]|uniref:helix-turn-helix domain-containing protein n=1 Tax=Streptomyces sp. NBC_00503 TaxID=2903659 RepID=UPI002E808C88|nr:XRE family transcriptional regulator [Streptomyces sp. NBC_00503]WUD84456.1 XRE family transcriptional regulator [Streptomyces sp. NBC_00503]